MGDGVQNCDRRTSDYNYQSFSTKAKASVPIPVQSGAVSVLRRKRPLLQMTMLPEALCFFESLCITK